jgi:hypothetical protein
MRSTRHQRRCDEVTEALGGSRWCLTMPFRSNLATRPAIMGSRLVSIRNHILGPEVEAERIVSDAKKVDAFDGRVRDAKSTLAGRAGQDWPR